MVLIIAQLTAWNNGDPNLFSCFFCMYWAARNVNYNEKFQQNYSLKI